MLDFNEVKKWDGATGDAKIKELRVELFRLRMQKTTSGVATPHRMKNIKKDIARIMTVQNAKSEK